MSRFFLCCVGLVLALTTAATAASAEPAAACGDDGCAVDNNNNNNPDNNNNKLAMRITSPASCSTFVQERRHDVYQSIVPFVVHLGNATANDTFLVRLYHAKRQSVWQFDIPPTPNSKVDRREIIVCTRRDSVELLVADDPDEPGHYGQMRPLCDVWGDVVVDEQDGGAVLTFHTHLDPGYYDAVVAPVDITKEGARIVSTLAPLPYSRFCVDDADAAQSVSSSDGDNGEAAEARVRIADKKRAHAAELAERALREERVMSQFTPLHAHLRALNAERHLHPAFLAAFRAAVETGDGAPLRRLATTIVPGDTPVFSLPLFTDEFCAALRAELEYIQLNYSDIVTRPNSMNRHGIVTGDFGFRPLFAQLQAEFIAPLSQLLFPLWAGGDTSHTPLNDHHAFTIQYHGDDVRDDDVDSGDADGAGSNENITPENIGDNIVDVSSMSPRNTLRGDTKLDVHMDQSLITVNACVGGDFQGGDVFFNGARDSANERASTVEAEVAHRVGHALIHVGQHWHGARHTRGGERYNVVLWSRSHAALQSPYERFEEECSATSGGSIISSDDIDVVDFHVDDVESTSNSNVHDEL